MADNDNKKSLTGFFTTWAILTILGVAISLWAPARFMPSEMTHNMHLSVLTIVIFSVAAAPVAAGVYAAMLHVLRHHTYKGDTPPPSAEATRENPKLVTGWVLVSTLLTVFLLVWGLGALAFDDSSTSSSPLEVNVTGQQWLWTFSYPGTNVQSNVLNVPIGREVEFHITSEDVTHGFWIPQFGIQVDANSGVETVIHATPDKTGTIDIRCDQFCGLNHAYMVTQGHVMTNQQFEQWLHSQSTGS